MKHSVQVKAEIHHLMDTLKEQFESINSQEGRIPRIEIDLMMSTLRNLYEQVYQLGKTQEGTALPHNASQETVMIQASVTMAAVQEPERSFEPAISQAPDILNTQSIKEDESSTEPAALPVIFEFQTPAAVIETPVIEVQPENPVVLKEETIIVTQTEKSIRKNGQTADLFDEVTTVAESYSVKTTLHDKMTSGKSDRSIADHLQQQPLSDLKKSIGINEKFAFVNELFSGNHNLFNSSIDKLNSFNAYDQARKHLFEELAGQMNWNTTSKAFTDLNELVRRRFNS